MSESEVDQLAHALAGAGGGILSIALTYPLVTLTTVAQAQKKRNEEVVSAGSSDSEVAIPRRSRLWSLLVGPQSESINEAEKLSSSNIAVLKDIVAKHGIRGLYNGLESAVVGNAATNFLYYYFYELTGKSLTKRTGNPNSNAGLGVGQSIAAGAIAGSISRVATNPIWVTNTRMTVLARDQPELKKLNTFQALVYLAKTEGVKGLFNGVIPSLLLVLNPIIQYTVFEQLKTLILKIRRRKVTALDALLAGALGKLIATIVTYPYITLRSRLHVSTDGETNELKATYNLARDMLKTEGVASFYRGLSAKLTQSVVAAAFLFFFKQELVTSSDRLVKSVLRRKTQPVPIYLEAPEEKEL